MMDVDNIRQLEELYQQINFLGKLKEMAAMYGFDISLPAVDSKEAVQWLYFSWRDQKIRLEAFKEGAPQEETTRNMIAFNDERGVMQLSIKCDQLLFIEASGNYINIAYSHNNRIRKTLVRNTLKEVENTYSDSELIRCHRSYIVNFSNVKLMRKTKEGLVLELEAPEPSEIPVSKSYIEKVMHRFSHSVGNN